MAGKFRCRPSELLNVSHSVEAFYLDRAVYTFGSHMEADLEEATKSTGKKADKPEVTKMKRERRLALWMQSSDGPKFRDPNVEGM